MTARAILSGSIFVHVWEPSTFAQDMCAGRSITNTSPSRLNDKFACAPPHLSLSGGKERRYSCLTAVPLVCRRKLFHTTILPTEFATTHQGNPC